MEPYDTNKNDEAETSKDVSFGPIIAIIIIVALLIIGALYMWKKISPQNSLPTGSAISGDSVVSQFARQGSSDNIAEIRRDLSATSIQALGQGLGDLKP